MRALAVLVTILAIPALMSAPTVAQAGSPMEDTLRDALAAKRIPEDLTITYDDMHERYGGVRVVIPGDGSATRTFRPAGDGSKPVVTTYQVTPRNHLELIELLVDLKVWIRLQELTEVSDGQRGKLSVKAGDSSCGIFERYEDMAKKDRLRHVRTKILAITEVPPPAKPAPKKKTKKLNAAGR